MNLKQLNTKEAYEPQMDWEKPSKDVDPFSDAGWEKYRSFKHGSATADKMAKDEDKRGNKRFGKYDDKGNWHGVSTSDPAQWKELIARGYKLQESWKTPYFVKEAVEENIYAKNKYIIVEHSVQTTAMSSENAMSFVELSNKSASPYYAVAPKSWGGCR